MKKWINTTCGCRIKWYFPEYYWQIEANRLGPLESDFAADMLVQTCQTTIPWTAFHVLLKQRMKIRPPNPISHPKQQEKNMTGSSNRNDPPRWSAAWLLVFTDPSGRRNEDEVSRVHGPSWKKRSRNSFVSFTCEFVKHHQSRPACQLQLLPLSTQIQRNFIFARCLSKLSSILGACYAMVCWYVWNHGPGWVSYMFSKSDMISLLVGYMKATFAISHLLHTNHLLRFAAKKKDWNMSKYLPQKWWCHCALTTGSNKPTRPHLLSAPWKPGSVLHGPSWQSLAKTVFFS